MKRLIPLLACGCNAILGIPEPSLTQTGAPDARLGAPDAKVLPPDAPVPDAMQPDAKIVFTVTFLKSGSGTVTSDVGGLDCGDGCAGDNVSVELGGGINFSAKPAPGFYFAGWSGACTGIGRFCSVSVDGNKSVTATFAANDHNIMFATSQTMKGDFGGIAAADTLCDGDAKSAGLTGKFIALMSDNSTSARARLVVPGTSTPSRGFVRMDGKPIADTLADLMDNHRVWFPITFDEQGAASQTFLWTGTNPDGSISTDNCNNWKSASTNDHARWGSPTSGPGIVSDFSFVCDAPNAILCVQIDKTAAVTAPAAVTGRRMWVTKANFMSGGGLAAANTLCASEKPAGVTQVEALLPTTAVAASSLIERGALYVRPDGVPIGQGSDFGSRPLISAPWVHGDASYATDPCCILRGPGAFDSLPPANGVCNDWISTSSTLKVVHMELQAAGFWDPSSGPSFDCTSALKLICFETTP